MYVYRYIYSIFDVRVYFKGGKILTIREKDVVVSIATSDSYSYKFFFASYSREGCFLELPRTRTIEGCCYI